MDYANTTNVEFIVDPKVLSHGWLIYNCLQIFKLIKCKWLPEECAEWFFDNIMIWSYCLHRWYSMSRQKNGILINEHALNFFRFWLALSGLPASFRLVNNVGCVCLTLRSFLICFQQCDKLQDNFNVVLSLQEQLARMQQVGWTLLK